MSIKVVDTTLRDGEQKAGIALGINEKVQIAKILDDMGIFQIEAGIAAMGGDEKESIRKIVKLGLKSKISSWNRMNIEDINESMDCSVDIIHISVPVSDIQIEDKLKKNKSWILENVEKCVQYAVSKGYEVTVGLEDASRADINFLIEVCRLIYSIGVKRVRYADTVGILYPRRVFHQINKIREAVPIEIEVHAHNDFGMAIINSIGALKAGAKYVDCTITGIGERAGNCDFLEFAKTIYELLGEKVYLNEFSDLKNKENIIKGIIG